MGNIRTVVIDDEKNSRELIIELVRRHFPEIKIVGEASSVFTGIATVEDQKPDLLFLDIEMADGNGFDILDAFDAPSFRVIFITGYQEFAIKAFKYAALDYILKPVNLNDLKVAINSYKELNPISASQIETYKSLHSGEKGISETKQLILATNSGYQIVPFSEIIKIEAMESYSRFYLKSNVNIVTSHHLKYYEDLLPVHIFFRVHKSYIVNLSCIKKITHTRGAIIELSDGSKVDVAVRRKALLLEFLLN